MFDKIFGPNNAYCLLHCLLESRTKIKMPGVHCESVQVSGIGFKVRLHRTDIDQFSIFNEDKKDFEL